MHGVVQVSASNVQDETLVSRSKAIVHHAISGPLVLTASSQKSIETWPHMLMKMVSCGADLCATDTALLLINLWIAVAFG